MMTDLIDGQEVDINDIRTHRLDPYLKKARGYVHARSTGVTVEQEPFYERIFVLVGDLREGGVDGGINYHVKVSRPTEAAENAGILCESTDIELLIAHHLVGHETVFVELLEDETLGTKIPAEEPQ
ncbi:hypothetical protein HOD83_03300 [Candidatus Woesearchaeota archaeon]|jgi:hypothetical protein|nr:hypothetical protein [Candidatus Woesearchaeota archaeon]MBT4114402.1 hypothetical protein [Candidatus Woesearchaeota archaeon]MBT4248582.1 hypothetical protein [Candidatus Woesearchaeota archaeon]